MAIQDKENLGNGDLGLDDQELPNFSMGDLETEINTPLKPDRHPVRDFRAAAQKSLGNELSPDRVIRSILRSTLPQGYIKAWMGAEFVWSQVKSMGADLRRQSAGDLIALTERLEAVMPRIRDKTPGRIYQKLDEHLQRSKGILQSDVEMNRPGVTPEQRAKLRDDQAIADIMAETMDFQHKVAKTQDETAELRFQKERAASAIRDKVQQTQFGGIVSLMSQTNESLSKISAYNDQINYKFQRKQLEVQYRTYFAMRDLKALAAKTLQLQAEANKALVRNTGLPDLLKFTGQERLRMGLVNGGREGNGRGGLSGFLSNYGNDTQNKLRGELSTRAQMLGMAGRLGGSTMGMGGNPYEIAGAMLGQYGGGYLRNTLLPAAARRARPFAGRVSNRLGAQDAMLQYYMNNAPAMLQDYANTDTATGGWRGGMKSMLRRVTPQFHLNSASSGTGYQNIDRAATFNQLTNRSIIEVIPGLLSKILNELTMTRTGVPSEPETFDVVSGQFTSQSKARESLISRIVPDNARANVKQSLDAAMLKYDPDNKLSEGAKRALKERLIKDSASNKHFNVHSYSNPTTYPGSIDPAVRVELSGHFQNMFEFDDKGGFKSTAKNNTSRNDMSDALLNLRGVVRDPGDELRRVVNSGAEGQLRQMGLLNAGKHGDEINYDALWKLYLDGPNRPGAPPSPLGGGSADRQRISGMRSTGAVNGAGEGPGLRARYDLERGLTEAQVSELTTLVSPSSNASTTVRAQAQEILAEHWAKQAAGKPGYGERAKGLFDQTRGKLNDMSVQLGTDAHLANLTSIASGTMPATEAVRAQAQAVLAEYWSKAKQTGGTAASALSSGAMVIGGGIAASASAVAGLVQDIYVKGRGVPVLLARDIRAGKYYDLLSKSIITKIEDITGPVLDDQGNTVLSEEDIKEGLLTPDGKDAPIKQFAGLGARIGGGFGSAFSTMANNVRTVGRVVGFLASGPMKLAGMLFNRGKDIYVAGEQTPRMLAKKMRAGEYRSAWTNEPVLTVDDIKGDTVDSNGEMVLTAADIPNMVDAKGKRIKGKGFIRKAVGGYINMSKKYYGWLGRKVFGGKDPQGDGVMGNIRRGVTGALSGGWSKWDGVKLTKEQQGDPMLQLLARMNDKLGRMAPEEVRKGGWKDIFSRRDKEKEEKATKREQLSGKNPLGGMGAGIASLLGMFKKRQEKEDAAGEEEEDGGVNIDVGGIGGGGGDESEETPKEKARREKIERRMNRKRSKLGKAWHFAKGKLGTLAKVGVGLLGAEGLGTAALGMLGMGEFAGALGTAASLAGTVGAGLMAVLTSPITLGVAAVAAVGIGGYLLWNHYKSNRDSLRQLRLAQYGVNPESEGQALKVLNCESYYQKFTSMGTSPSVDTSKLDPMEVAKIFGVDIKEAAHVQALTDWLARRFIPVYTKHIQALARLAPNVMLNEIDDKLDKKLYKPYVDATTFSGGDSPYWVVSSPFGQDPLSGNQQLILTLTEKVLKNGDAPDDTVKSVSGAVGAVAAVGVMGLNGAPSAAASLANGGLLAPGTGMLKMAALGGGTAFAMSGKLPYKPFDGKLLSELQAIRFRAYGLKEFVKSSVNALFNLENAIEQYVRVAPDGEATFNGDTMEMLAKYGPLFGVPTDAETPEGVAWRTWFESRFVPVIVARASAMKQLKLSITTAQADTQLGASEQSVIANAIMGASGQYHGATTSIWNVPATLFKDNTSMDLQRLAQLDLKILIDKAAKERYAAPADAYTINSGKYADPGKTPLMMVDAINRSMSNNGQSKEATATDMARNMGITSIYGAKGIKDPSGFGTGGVGPLVAGGAMGTQGNSASITQGNGGKWEEIPMPTSDGNYAAAKATFEAAAKMTGVDAGLLATTVGIESNFKAGARPASGTAGGWMQFIDSTFTEQMKRHASKYGIPGNATKFDPRVAVLLGAEFLKENAKILKAKLGREPTDTDLYAAHFFGPGGASKFLTADTNANASQLFPGPAKSNPTIFYHPNGAARTVGEVYALFEQKVSKHRYGGGKSTTQAMPAGKASESPVSGGGATTPTPGPVGIMAPGAPSVSAATMATVNPAASAAAAGVPATFSAAPAQQGEEGATAESQRLVEKADQLKSNAVAVDKQKGVAADQTAASSGEMVSLSRQSVTLQTEQRDILREILAVMNRSGVGQGPSSAQQPSAPQAPAQQQRSSPAAAQRGISNAPMPLVMKR